METLRHFQIPVKGLSDGTHQFEFLLEDEFFSSFENSPIPGGKVSSTLTFDKRPGLFVLDFSLDGTVKSDCDRCLAKIDLPIEGMYRLYIKLSNGVDTPDEDDADIVVLPPETDHLDVARYLYEYSVLAMPMIKVYACREEENPPCNEAMLDRLDANAQAAEEDRKANQSSVWDALKDWGKEQ